MKHLYYAISDLHLSDHVPTVRGETPDQWLSYQMAWLDQIMANASRLQVPVLIAGDIFDNPHPSYRLLSRTIDVLKRYGPKVYAVPGQHDMIHHQRETLDETGYGMLQRVGAITNVDTDIEVTDNLVIYGFGWGDTPKSLSERMYYNKDDKHRVALLHYYVWMDETNKYPGATEDHHIDQVIRYAKNSHTAFRYDSIVIGDNHKRWISKTCRTAVSSGKQLLLINNGCWTVRSSSEVETCGAATLVSDDERGRTVTQLLVDGQTPLINRHHIQKAETDKKIRVRVSDKNEQHRSDADRLLEKLKDAVDVLGSFNSLMQQAATGLTTEEGRRLLQKLLRESANDQGST